MSDGRKSYGFVLETGENHPGSTLWVRVRDGKLAFQMTNEPDYAMTFTTERAAMARAKKFSVHYGLRAVEIFYPRRHQA